MERLLVLVRHGQSDWNLKNLFTGWKDPDLTEKGIIEAQSAGQRLKSLEIKFYYIKKEMLYLISIAFFLSPTLRSLSIWPYPLVYAILFFVISIYFFLKFIN